MLAGGPPGLSRSRSARTRSVTSCARPTTRVGSAWSSVSTWPRQKKSRSSPSARIMRASNSNDRRSETASPITASTRSRSSGCTRSRKDSYTSRTSAGTPNRRWSSSDQRTWFSAMFHSQLPMCAIACASASCWRASRRACSWRWRPVMSVPEQNHRTILPGGVVLGYGAREDPVVPAVRAQHAGLDLDRLPRVHGARPRRLYVRRVVRVVKVQPPAGTVSDPAAEKRGRALVHVVEPPVGVDREDLVRHEIGHVAVPLLALACRLVHRLSHRGVAPHRGAGARARAGPARASPPRTRWRRRSRPRSSCRRSCWRPRRRRPRARGGGRSCGRGGCPGPAPRGWPARPARCRAAPGAAAG